MVTTPTPVALRVPQLLFSHDSLVVYLCKFNHFHSYSPFFKQCCLLHIPLFPQLLLPFLPLPLPLLPFFPFLLLLLLLCCLHFTLTGNTQPPDAFARGWRAEPWSSRLFRVLQRLTPRKWKGFLPKNRFSSLSVSTLPPLFVIGCSFFETLFGLI